MSKSSTGSSRAARWFAHTTFGFWQALGLHVTPNHYYEPVPDTRHLPDSLWARRSAAAGIDLRLSAQVQLLSRLTKYAHEFDALVSAEPKPGTYFIDNPSLGAIDASVYYGMLRERKPRQVTEIGSGYSTIIAAAALEQNAKEGSAGTLTVIEPYPPAWLQRLKGVTRHLTQPVQEVALDTFTRLQKGDVLFIDSSHVLKAGSDVQYEVLEILPRLAPGVAVHLHDIFIPNEYPRDWIVSKKRFWTEQYMLRAFLACNDHFAVRWSGNLLVQTHRAELGKLSTHVAPDEQPGSFWIERTT